MTLVPLIMPVIKQTLLANVHTVLDPEEFLAQNRCVPKVLRNPFKSNHQNFYLTKNRKELGKNEVGS